MRLVSHARKNLSTDCAGLPILATDEVRKPSHFRLTVVFDTARLPPCAVAIESVPFAFGMNEWLKLERARRGVRVRNWVLAAETDEGGRAELPSSSISRTSAFPILRQLSLLLANRVRVLRLLVDLNVRTMRDHEFIGSWDQNE